MAISRLHYKTLPYLPAQIRFADLQFLKNKDTLNILICTIDELEKQRQNSTRKDDMRYRKKLLQTLSDYLPPELKRYSFIKLDNNYYLVYDGVKKAAHIGSGSYGCVKYGINILTEELVAVKILSQTSYSVAKIENAGMDEARRLDQVDNLIGAFPSFSLAKKFQYHIIQRLAQGCNLDAFNNNSKAGVYERLHVFLQVCKNVNALHERGIVHGDISLYNIIYDAADGTVKLVDYGKSSQLQNIQSGIKQKGWHNILPKNHEHAPETFDPKGIFTTQSDVFNIGRVMGYFFRFIDQTFQLQPVLSDHFKNNQDTVANYFLRASINIIIKKMIQPNAQRRLSLTEVMMQLEKLLMRVALDPAIRENVGIVNIEKILSDPGLSQKLLEDLKRLKIKRVILIDPSNNDINDNHIKLIKLLELNKIVVGKNIFFEKVKKRKLNSIITQHYKSLGMVFNYHYIDATSNKSLKTDIAEQLGNYNAKLSALYSKVMNLKNRKKLLGSTQSQEFKNQAKALKAECAALKTLANELGQTDFMLTKLQKTLTSIQRVVPRLFFSPVTNKKTPLVLPTASNGTKFYINNNDGYFASVYRHTKVVVEKVNCIFTLNGCVFNKDAVFQYKGTIQPVTQINDIPSLFKEPHFIFYKKAHTPIVMVDAAKAGELETVLQYIDENCHSASAAVPVSKYLGMALQWAALHGHHHIVKVLVNALGIDVNFTGTGDPALSFAALAGYLDIVETLLATKGINVNLALAKNSHNALTHAAVCGHYKIVRALLAAGADVNHRTIEGHSALLFAAAYGHPNVIVELLKDPKLDLNLKGKEGFTALELAQQHNYTEIIHLLTGTAALSAGNMITRKTL